MANLSNINNKFIVTDVGTGQAIVGATNAVSGVTLTVGGSAYLGPIGTTDASTIPEMQTNAVLTLKPHNTNSTNMVFSRLTGGATMGVQTTNGPGTAAWHIALSPFLGNVGIGTGDTAPGSKLTILGTSTAASNTPSQAIVDIKSTSTAHLLMGVANVSPYGAWINTDATGQPLVLMGTGGNVGIGTIGPTAKLQIGSNVDPSQTAESLVHLLSSTTSSTVNGFTHLKLDYTSGASPGTAGAQIMFNQGYHPANPDYTQPVGSIRGWKTGADYNYGGGLQLLYQPDATALGLLVGMTLTGGGNVGIGTTNPQQNFVVSNTTNGQGIEIVPGTSGIIQAYDRTAGDYVPLFFDAKRIQPRATEYFTVSTGSAFTERMRITSGGDIWQLNGAATAGTYAPWAVSNPDAGIAINVPGASSRYLSFIDSATPGYGGGMRYFETSNYTEIYSKLPGAYTTHLRADRGAYHTWLNPSGSGNVGIGMATVPSQALVVKDGMVVTGANSIAADTSGGYICALGANSGPKSLHTKGYITADGGIRLGGSASANQLDDYEEGNWTPTISHNDGTGVIPLGVSGGAWYVKVGRLVHVFAYLVNVNPNGNAGGSGPYYAIRGLPFTAISHSTWSVAYATAPMTSYGGYAGGDNLYFMKNGTNGQCSNSHVNGTFFNTWGQFNFMFQAVYQTNS